MAVEVGSAVVSIVPSIRGFTGSVQSQLSRERLGERVGAEMGRGAGQSGDKAGGLFSRAFNQSSRRGVNFPGPSVGLLRTIRTYGFALSTVGSLTVGFGLKTASSMEQAQVAFTTMLGSASRAQSFLAELVTFAQKTPFDLPGVVSASQKLLAFGFSAKQVLPTLTAIGDASAGLGLGAEGLDRITTAIGQIRAKGKVQSDEILQLTEAGVPALAILANQFHTTTAKMQDFITNGLVPANQAIPALLSGLETGTNGLAGQTTRFGGLMDKQSHTLGGIFSNLRDTVSQGLAQAVQPLVPVLEQNLPRIMTVLQGVFRTAATDMHNFLVGLGLIRDTTPGVASGFEQFGRAVAGTVGVVRSVFGFIADHPTLFLTLGSALLGAAVGAKAFGIAMAIVNLAMAGSGIGAVVLAVGALAGAFIYSWKTSQTFRDVVTGVFVVVGEGAVALGRALYDTLVAPFRALFGAVAAIPGAINPLHGAAQSALNALNNVDTALNHTNTWLDNLTKHPHTVTINVVTTTSNLPKPKTVGGKKTFPIGFVGPIPKGAQRGPLAPQGFSSTGGFDLDKNGGGSFGTAPANTIAGVFGKLPTALKAVMPKVKKAAAESATQIADAILGPLRALEQKAADLAKGIVDAITGSTGLGSLASRTDIMGNQTRQSLAGLIKGLTAQKKAVLDFRRELQTLTKRGLSGADANTLANLGLDQGGALAQTLMGATTKQLKQISGLTGGITKGATAIGQDRASATFGPAIGAELVRVMNAVEKKQHDTDLSRKTVAAVGSAVGKEIAKAKLYVNVTQLDRAQGRATLSALAR